MSMEKMFSPDAMAKVTEANQKEQKKLKQINLTPGFHISKLDGVELVKSKKGDPMYVLTISKKDDPDSKFKPVSEYFVITEDGLKTREGLNMNLYNFLSFFINCFKFVPKDIDQDDPLGDILTKITIYFGKEFRAVVSSEESLNSKQTAKFTSIKLETKRSAHINDTSVKPETAPKIIKRLTPKEAAILSGKILPDNIAVKASKDNLGSPDITDDAGDDLPF